MYVFLYKIYIYLSSFIILCIPLVILILNIIVIHNNININNSMNDTINNYIYILSIINIIILTILFIYLLFSFYKRYNLQPLKSKSPYFIIVASLFSYVLIMMICVSNIIKLNCLLIHFIIDICIPSLMLSYFFRSYRLYYVFITSNNNIKKTHYTYYNEEDNNAENSNAFQPIKGYTDSFDLINDESNYITPKFSNSYSFLNSSVSSRISSPKRDIHVPDVRESISSMTSTPMLNYEEVSYMQAVEPKESKPSIEDPTKYSKWPGRQRYLFAIYLIIILFFTIFAGNEFAFGGLWPIGIMGCDPTRLYTASIIWICIHVFEAILYLTALYLMSNANVWRELSSKRELQLATAICCFFAAFILVFIMVHRIEELSTLLPALIWLRASLLFVISLVNPLYVSYTKTSSSNRSTTSTLPHFGSVELLGSLTEVLQDPLGFPYYVEFIKDTPYEIILKCWLEIEMFTESYQDFLCFENNSSDMLKFSFDYDENRGRVFKINADAINSPINASLSEPIVTQYYKKDVDDMRREQMIEDANQICARYFKEYLENPNNTQMWQYTVLSQSSTSALFNTSERMFDKAQDEILDFLELETYPAFLTSPHVKQLLLELKKQESVVDGLILNALV